MTATLWAGKVGQTSDEEFRAWGKAVSDAIQLGGIVKTADTGQIDWATVSKPAAINTSQGYEIYRFADSLQSTAPVFFRLDYGSGSDAKYASLWLTVGTGSDGNGTITGVVIDSYQITHANSGSATNKSIITSFTNGLVISLIQATSGGYGMYFTLERTHDSTSADTSAGVMCNTLKGTTKQSIYAPFSGTVFTYANIMSLLPPTGSGASAPDIHLYPVRFFTPGEGPVSNLCAAYFSADFATDSTYTVNFLGTDKTFRTTQVLSSSVGYGASTAYLMFIFE
jgi:hypothetical protein